MKNIEIYGLLDSGASICVLGKDCDGIVKKLNLRVTPLCTHLRTADGNKQQIIGFVNIPVTYGKLEKDICFYLAPGLNQTAYLGINFWKEFNIAPQLFISKVSLDSETFCFGMIIISWIYPIRRSLSLRELLGSFPHLVS